MTLLKPAPSMPRILLVDDDVDLTAMLAEYLADEGFSVEVAETGATGAARAITEACDLVVLDVMLPDQSGIETLRQVRTESNVPVLMLTARGDEIDKVVGLELGADDYVPKPCTPRELAARIRAILRRTTRFTAPNAPPTEAAPVTDAGAGVPVHGINSAPGVAGTALTGSRGGAGAGATIDPPTGEPAAGDDGRAAAPLKAGALTVWPRSRRTEWQGEPIALTSTQFSVLEVLVRHAGTVVGKADLSRQALGRPLGRFDRSVDVHISILRQRLGGPDGGDALIKTVRGIGYQLAVE